MWRHLITTVFLVLTLATVLSFPWVVGGKPKNDATRYVKAKYYERMMYYISACGIFAVCAATSAMVLARHLRTTYEDERLKNLADLITQIPQPKQNDGDSRS